MRPGEFTQIKVLLALSPVPVKPFIVLLPCGSAIQAQGAAQYDV